MAVYVPVASGVEITSFGGMTHSNPPKSAPCSESSSLQATTARRERHDPRKCASCPKCADAIPCRYACTAGSGIAATHCGASRSAGNPHL